MIIKPGDYVDVSYRAEVLSLGKTLSGADTVRLRVRKGGSTVDFFAYASDCSVVYRPLVGDCVKHRGGGYGIVQSVEEECVQVHVGSCWKIDDISLYARPEVAP